MKNYFPIAVLTSICSLFSCSFLETPMYGNGTVVTQSRAVFSAFDKVSVEGIGNIIIQNSPSAVSVSTDSNLQEYIEVFVDESTLRVKIRDYISITSYSNLIVVISMPSLSSLSSSGTSDITTGSFTESSLNIKNTGTGDISVSGVIDSLTITLTGTGSVKTGTCTAKTALVSLAGTGNIFTYASSSISGSNTGIGTITCYGNPPGRNITVTGIGSVIYP